MAGGLDVRANPEEIERFARELDRFNNELRNSARRVRGAHRQLGAGWLDHKARRFAQEFDQMMRAIDRFLQTSEQQPRFLKKEAQLLRQYLEHRR